MTGRPPLIDPPTAGLVVGITSMFAGMLVCLLVAKWRDAK